MLINITKAEAIEWATVYDPLKPHLAGETVSGYQMLARLNALITRMYGNIRAGTSLVVDFTAQVVPDQDISAAFVHSYFGRTRARVSFDLRQNGLMVLAGHVILVME